MNKVLTLLLLLSWSFSWSQNSQQNDSTRNAERIGHLKKKIQDALEEKSSYEELQVEIEELKGLLKDATSRIDSLERALLARQPAISDNDLFFIVEAQRTLERAKLGLQWNETIIGSPLRVAKSAKSDWFFIVLQTPFREETFKGELRELKKIVPTAWFVRRSDLEEF